MQIICPNCRTSYGVTATALGSQGRNVRCAKCKQVWLATAEDAIATHALADMNQGGGDAAGQRDADERASAGETWREADAPVVESPSIAHDGSSDVAPGWSTQAQQADASDVDDEPVGDHRSRRSALSGAGRRIPRPRLSLSGVIAAMAALILGLIIWRVDIVRLLPQTATFFKMAAMNVNLRNLSFEDVRVSTETVNGAAVTVIEGVVAGTGMKPVEIPRLRFVVRDERGTAIYAWNAVLDQAVLEPGEKAPFKSRLASPPPNAHDLIVRFFNKRDIAAGGT